MGKRSSSSSSSSSSNSSKASESSDGDKRKKTTSKRSTDRETKKSKRDSESKRYSDDNETVSKRRSESDSTRHRKHFEDKQPRRHDREKYEQDKRKGRENDRREDGYSGGYRKERTEDRHSRENHKYERNRNQRYNSSRDNDRDHNQHNYQHRRSYDNRDRSRSEYDRHNSKYRNRRSRSASIDHANPKWGKSEQDTSSNANKAPPKKVEKEKVNFGTSGKLTEETNTYRGVVIKYSEPPEARKPKRRWRLYPFKGEKALQTLYIHRESAYLIGRERKVVDIPVDHPSCSKQHAALQYRLVSYIRDDYSTGKRVRPYLIDLESANGTYINNKKIEPRKYIELLERDVIKFGYSSREYVLLHENSKDEALDDDVKQEEEVDVKNEIKEETR